MLWRVCTFSVIDVYDPVIGIVGCTFEQCAPIGSGCDAWLDLWLKQEHI